MCEHCQDLQRKIDRYLGFTKQPFDALTIERIRDLVEQMKERLRKMH
jgi:hypothetical protein